MNRKLLKRKRAYTLIEMITVIVIIGILTAVSLPAFNNLRRGARLKASARRITSALRLARRLAITQNNIYSVSFNVANNTFGIIDGESGSDTIEKRFSLDDTITFDSDTAGVPGDPVNFTNDMVVYKANGGAKTGGRIWIKSAEGKYMNISVLNTSGRVRIYPGETRE